MMLEVDIIYLFDKSLEVKYARFAIMNFSPIGFRGVGMRVQQNSSLILHGHRLL